MKFANYLGHNDYQTGQVGLEIETESTKGYAYIPGLEEFWITQADGSLRQNGVEYVFRRPYSPSSKEYVEALELFRQQVKATKFVQSTYSSVHVHLNMLDKTLNQIMNFICLYFIFEEILAEYCGNDRNGNLFCLKTSNAEMNFRAAVELAEAIDQGSGVRYIQNLNNGLLKYSGLNLVPLRNLGSLEVRLHPGCTDVDLIDRWVNILMRLYNAADRYASPVDIVNASIDRVRRFADEVFYNDSQYLNMNDLETKTKNGLWYATKIAGSVEDWKSFGSKKVPIKKKVKSPLANHEQLTRYYQELATNDLNTRINARNDLRNIVIEDF